MKLSEQIAKAEERYERGECSWNEALCRELFSTAAPPLPAPTPPPPKRTPGEIAAEKMIQPDYPDCVRVTYSENNSVHFSYDGKVDWLVGSLREAVAALIDAGRAEMRERAAKVAMAMTFADGESIGTAARIAAAIRALD